MLRTHLAGNAGPDSHKGVLFVQAPTYVKRMHRFALAVPAHRAVMGRQHPQRPTFVTHDRRGLRRSVACRAREGNDRGEESATTTPITGAKRARGPTALKKPAAMPDAGQNTAMSEPAESKASPRRAARKLAMATASAAPSAAIHSLAAGAETKRYRLAPWSVPGAFKTPHKNMVQGPRN